VAGLGTLTADIAYGCDRFVLTDARILGFSLTPAEAGDLTRVGTVVRHGATDQLGLTHSGHHTRRLGRGRPL
jgi:proline racemase